MGWIRKRDLLEFTEAVRYEAEIDLRVGSAWCAEQGYKEPWRLQKTSTRSGIL